MGTWIAVGLLVVVLWWLFVPRRRPAPVPEDDVTTPINQEELAEAERELREDPRPPSVEQGLDDEADDWGPGTR